MALARRRDRDINYWPGFVDALSTLVLGIIFLLTVFVVVQYVLSQEVSGKNTVLNRLNAQIAQLTQLLSMEKTSKISLQDQLAQLQASLATAKNERDKYKGLYQGLSSGASAAKGKVGALTSQLNSQKEISARALAQVEILNQQISALRRQLGALETALNASEKKNQKSQAHIADLGQRLNLALAKRVQELSRYRSNFFGRLRAILGNRPDIRIVGDRFVFQSEIFFDPAQAVVKPAGQQELDKLADAVIQLEQQIPKDIPWVLQVNGYTDKRPISTPQFASNWELSAARAISVVKYLISKGVEPQRLAAAGFAQYDPIDTGDTPEAYARNRRIELKLTQQ